MKAIVISALVALAFTTGFTCSKNQPAPEVTQEQAAPAPMEATPAPTDAAPANPETAPTEVAPAPAPEAPPPAGH